jgi:predicted nuclease of restriction endonuclease-like (RecB) superfamily
MTEIPARLGTPPAGYADWLAELKTRIHAAQQRATLAVNRELVLLYWQIGRDILARQAEQGWGARVIDRLAADLRTAFPDMKGFSPRNLKYMRAFAEAWPNEQFVQQAVAQLPWGHNLVLLDRLPGPGTRKWYAAQAIEHNWSRNVLVIQIESRLLERTGATVTNFPATLPAPHSDLARESLKDLIASTSSASLTKRRSGRSRMLWSGTSPNSCSSSARALPSSAGRSCSMWAARSSSSICCSITSSCAAMS